MSKIRFRPREPAAPSLELQPDAAAHPGMGARDDDLAPSRLTLLPSTQSGDSSALPLDLGGLSNQWRQSRDEFEEARLDYVLADLDECLAFAAIVEAEYRTGDREHAERTLAAIEECYSDMLRFYQLADGLEPSTRAEFESRFKRVRERLDRIRE